MKVKSVWNSFERSNLCKRTAQIMRDRESGEGGGGWCVERENQFIVLRDQTSQREDWNG